MGGNCLKSAVGIANNQALLSISSHLGQISCLGKDVAVIMRDDTIFRVIIPQSNLSCFWREHVLDYIVPSRKVR